MKTDNRVILDLSDYDQVMLLTVLIFAFRLLGNHPGESDQQMKDWVKQMLIRIDPLTAAKMIEDGQA